MSNTKSVVVSEGQNQLQTQGLTTEQWELVKRTLCEGATDDEFQMFMGNCNRTQLDPLARQIYFVKIKGKNGKPDKTQSAPTIDGLRIIAQRSGQYAGQLGPYWCGKDGKWRDIWLGGSFPVAARVAVLRQDFKEPLWGIAMWEEYVQKNQYGVTHIWKTKGAHMLAKCAEAIALRKAFPQDLSGLYSPDEISKEIEVESEVNPVGKTSPPSGSSAIEPKKSAKSIPAPEGGEVKVNQNQIRELQAIAKEHDWTNAEVNELIKSHFGRDNALHLTVDEALELGELLSASDVTSGETIEVKPGSTVTVADGGQAVTNETHAM